MNPPKPMPQVQQSNPTTPMSRLRMPIAVTGPGRGTFATIQAPSHSTVGAVTEAGVVVAGAVGLVVGAPPQRAIRVQVVQFVAGAAFLRLCRSAKRLTRGSRHE